MSWGLLVFEAVTGVVLKSQKVFLRFLYKVCQGVLHIVHGLS